MIYGNPAVNAEPPLKKGDKIVEANGVKVSNVATLRRQLYVDAMKPVELLIERETGDEENRSTEQIMVTIGPNPARELDFDFGWGTIEAVQIGSPAETAGFKKGDKIIAVEGFESESALTFDTAVSDHLAESGGAIEFTVEREGSEQTISVTPIPSTSMSAVGSIGLMPLDSVGLAVAVSDRVANIDPGSKLVQAGISKGDQLISVKYLLSEEAQKEDWFKSQKLHEKEVDLSKASVAAVFQRIQSLPAGTEFQLVFKSGDSEKTVTVASTASSAHSLSTRGFQLTGYTSHYVSDTWSDAFSNGYKQVKNDAGRVWKFLTKLVTGKLSVTNMGGPGLIAVAATSEASQGTSRLLLFLTLLSANLAIVNFLPIPVLDGGHMVFLAYEGLFRRPVSEKVEILLTWGGLFFILGLMIFVSSMDAFRISKMF